MITSIAEGTVSGIRPFDPARDLRAVADLLEVAFVEELGPESRAFLWEMRAAGYLGPLLLFVGPLTGYSGFVWEEEGQVVGNVTLSHWDKGYLVSNVAVHPDFRRRGIARRLMEIALDWVKKKRAPWVILEVRPTNYPAKRLYDNLGFATLDSSAEMRLARTTAPRSSPGQVSVAEFSAQNWYRVYQLYRATLSPLAMQIVGREEEDFRPGIVPEWVNRLFLGREFRNWAVEKEGEFRATLTLKASRLGLPHRLEMMVHPQKRGQVEQALLTRALDFLVAYPKSPLWAKIYPYYEETVSVFRQHGFQEVRVLERMGKEV